MWFVLALISALGTDATLGVGIYTQSFETEEACKVEIGGIVDQADKELAPQGAIIKDAACVPREKVPPDLLGVFDRGRI